MSSVSILDTLIGKRIKRWLGIELAIDQGQYGEPVRFMDAPNMQFFDLQMEFDDLSTLGLRSRLDDDMNYYGLYFEGEINAQSIKSPDEEDILRTRYLDEFPNGRVLKVNTQVDEFSQLVVLELVLEEGSVVVRSGEAFSLEEGVDMVTPGEFLLVDISVTPAV